MLEILTSWFGDEPTIFELGPVYEHKLTHRTIIAHFIQAKYNDKPSKIPEKTQIIMESDVKTLPISRLIDRYLSKLWISLSNQFAKKYYLCKRKIETSDKEYLINRANNTTLDYDWSQ